MKRILMLSDGWKRLLTISWIAGAIDYIREQNLDITIDQFNCWADWSLNEGFNAGEYSIYTIPDLTAYDGIILDITNITHEDVKEELLNRIRASHVPAVSLCLDEPGIYYAGVDGRAAIATLISHLYDKHGCRSFFFAGGPKDNYENEERVRAYQESMEDLGLQAYASHLLYSDFDADGGRKCMRYILKNYDKLPDAVVCANDNIAVGVISEAEKHGLKVPRDFRVTGFDNFDKAAWYEPQLTTAALHREDIGALAVRILTGVWSGDPVDHYNYVSAPLIYAESCGCPNTHAIDYRKYVRNEVTNSIDNQETESAIAKLEYRLIQAEGTQEFSDTIMKEYAQMDLDGCAVFLNRQILDPDLESISDQMVLDQAKDDNTVVVTRDGVLSEISRHADDFARARAVSVTGELRIEPGDTLEKWLKNRSERDRGSVYYHIPLHVNAEPAGIVILRNPRFLLTNYRIFEVQDTILPVLQTKYQRARLERALYILRRLYDRDQLTGVYNRSAFRHRIEPACNLWHASGRRIAIVFIDVDHFKQINDRFGHAYGDRVLQQLARAMDRHIPDDGMVCRYGGDEFLAVFPYVDSSLPMDYRDAVSFEMEKHGISLSAGIHEMARGSFDENVEQADREMYLIKEAHHRNMKNS